jgi:hypothetical protein
MKQQTAFSLQLFHKEIIRGLFPFTAVFSETAGK